MKHCFYKLGSSSIFHKGRFCLKRSKTYDSIFEFEWSHGTLCCQTNFRFSKDERSITFALAFPGFSYYFTLNGLSKKLFNVLPFSFKRKYGGDERCVGFRIHHSAIWISLWEDEMSWDSKDPWWQSMRFGLNDIVDFFFGKAKYSEEVLITCDIKVLMPECSYDATAKHYIAHWVRSRFPWWPFSKKMFKTNIDVTGGIPVPGKGTTSYNCGDDAIYSLCAPGTIDDVLENLIDSVNYSRKNYPL